METADIIPLTMQIQKVKKESIMSGKKKKSELLNFLLVVKRTETKFFQNTIT